MDGGTAGMELLDPMAGRDHIVIVDAVRTGRAPGTPVTLRGDEIPAFFRTKLSPHQVGLSDVLATLRITGEYPKALVVVGIEPVSLATGLSLSGPVAARFDELVANVLAELAAVGIEPQRRSVPGRGQLAEAGCFAG
jgi:hydrogenase maturation protease